MRILFTWICVSLMVVGLSLGGMGCSELPCELLGDCDDGDPIEDPSPSPSETPLPMNPVCDGPQDFSGGTLWKPVGETSGNLVVLLDSDYVEEFGCSVERRDGGFENLVFTGFSNGDRQTFRGELPGNGYIDDGYVECEDSVQTCVFEFEGSSSQRHE